jgi:ribosomal protein L10
MGTQQTKTEQISTIKDAFARATSAVVLDYRGLTVKAATDVRH